MSIEIIAPFGEAWKRSCDLLSPSKRWLSLGLCLWLAYVMQQLAMVPYLMPPASGSSGLSEIDWSSAQGLSTALTQMADTTPKEDPVREGILFAVYLVLMAVFLWPACRGRFMWLDNAVRGTGEVARPWAEFKRDANRLYFFILGWGAASMVSIGLVSWIGEILCKPYLRGFETGELHSRLMVALVFSVVAFVMAKWFFFFQVLDDFALPIIYRRGCGPWEAMRDCMSLISKNPVDFILYYLFYSLLMLGLLIGLFVLACCTCCLGILFLMLPAIGAVPLLPVFATFRYYAVLFLRQYGDAYDVYQRPGLNPPAPPSDPPSVPV